MGAWRTVGFDRRASEADFPRTRTVLAPAGSPLDMPPNRRTTRFQPNPPPAAGPAVPDPPVLSEGPVVQGPEPGAVLLAIIP